MYNLGAAVTPFMVLRAVMDSSTSAARGERGEA